MKKYYLLIITLAVLTIQVKAQTPDQIKAYENYSKPSAAHKRLASEVGIWKGIMLSWIDTSGIPVKAAALYEISMQLNGLYQDTKFTSTYMNKPYKGYSLTGFNNSKKEYESIWVDDISSGMLKMTGFYDEGLNTYNYKGIQTDPLTGLDTEIRQEMKFTSPNSFTLTMYTISPDGKDFKFMEGTFIKQKTPIKKK
jgi:hypothetical protein